MPQMVALDAASASRFLAYTSLRSCCIISALCAAVPSMAVMSRVRSAAMILWVRSKLVIRSDAGNLQRCIHRYVFEMTAGVAANAGEFCAAKIDVKVFTLDGPLIA